MIVYKNAKPVVPLMYAWEFMPRPRMIDSGRKVLWEKDWESLKKIALQRGWQTDISYVKEVCRKNSRVVVVTETDQTILYVSSNFEEMTGYPPAEVIGRKPNLLQGPETEVSARQQIRKAVNTAEKVEVQLTNYRKNGEPYLCSVNIIPVFNANHQLVNFLALEKEVPSPV